uniref:Uncharacterized protein n=1 Tax=Arundo donax TaxID=35708 RepID=A0A0A9H7V9_ARUDO
MFILALLPTQVFAI